MNQTLSPGARFARHWQLVATANYGDHQCVLCFDGAAYGLSGLVLICAGCANASHGLPDLG